MKEKLAFSAERLFVESSTNPTFEDFVRTRVVLAKDHAEFCSLLVTTLAAYKEKPSQSEDGLGDEVPAMVRLLATILRNMCSSDSGNADIVTAMRHLTQPFFEQGPNVYVYSVGYSVFLTIFTALTVCFSTIDRKTPEKARKELYAILLKFCQVWMGHQGDWTRSVDRLRRKVTNKRVRECLGATLREWILAEQHLVLNTPNRLHLRLLRDMNALIKAEEKRLVGLNPHIPAGPLEEAVWRVSQIVINERKTPKLVRLALRK